MYTLEKDNASPSYMLCMLIPQTMLLFTLKCDARLYVL